MKKTALLIFIGLFWTFSACNIANLAAGDNNRNGSAKSAGNIAAENTEQTEEKPSGETDNQAKNLTGVYQSKDANHFNEFKIEDAGEGRLKVEFMGQYEFKTGSGSAMANTDQTDVLNATLDGDTAIVKVPDSPKCRYTLVFAGEKLTVRRDGSLTDCGLGGQIAPEGVYRKVSDKKPVFGEWFEAKKDAPETITEKESATSQDSNTVRVRFQKGSSEAILSGKIVSGAPVVYLVNARKGQTLEFRVLEGGENNDVVGEIFAPGGKNLTGEDYGTFWRGELPQTGDYKISIGTIETENVNFKIQIAIR